MRKAILIAALFALCLAGCGGGGSGSASTPAGEPSGVPSLVQLEPSQVVAQTNGSILLNAKVLDGNGRPVPGVSVKFSNVVSNKFITINPETAVTSALGVASVTLGSSTQDFVTVLAEVSSRTGSIIRDQKTMFFSNASSPSFPGPTLTLTVETSDGNNTLFEKVNDNVASIKATVRDPFGRPVANVPVTFALDVPFRATTNAPQCSNGETNCNVSFQNGNEKLTDENGVATAVITVVPFFDSLRDVIAVTATADNGAFNAASLFLKSVTISSVVVTATPETVAAGGTATLRATVFTSVGALVPDGTIVNFSADCGSVTPFAQTTTGQTPATGVTFTAPTAGDPIFPPGGAPLLCTVTAQAGGVRGEVTITVAPPASVQLSANPVTVAAGGTSTLTAGVLTSLGTLVPNGTIVTFTTTCGSVTPFAQTTNGLATGTFTAPGAGDPGFSPGGGGANLLCTVTARSGGVSGSVVITVTPPAPVALSVLPASVTVQGNGVNTADFIITGGTPPYNAISGNATVVPAASLVVTGQSLSVTPNAVAANTPVTITVTDSSTPVQARTATVNVTP